MANFNDNVPEKEKRILFRFFDICVHRFGKLVGVNLLYTLCSLPVIAVYFFLSALISSNFVPVGSENYNEAVTTLGATIAVFLFVALGGGPTAPGFIYVIRNFSRREHAFVVSDFFENIKKNLRQSIVIFIIDIVAITILFININAIMLTPQMFFGMHQPFAVIMIFVSVIYIGARMYLYPMMVTFRSPLRTLIKTSFMLFALKLPQTVLLVILTVAVFSLAEMLPIAIFLLFVVPLFLISFIGLMNTVYAYDVIKNNISMEVKEDTRKSK